MSRVENEEMFSKQRLKTDIDKTNLPRVDFVTRRYMDPDGRHWVTSRFLLGNFSITHKKFKRLTAEVPQIMGKGMNNKALILFDEARTEEILAEHGYYQKTQSTEETEYNQSIVSRETMVRLNECLSQIINDEPKKYKPETIGRVRTFLQYCYVNPDKKQPYRVFESIEDYKLFYELHPQWHGKSTKKMQDDKINGGQAFYASLNSWVLKQTRDRTKRRELITQIFDPYYINRSSLITIEDWQSEYKKHPEWQGKSPKQLHDDKKSGAAAFYGAFCDWLKREVKERRLRNEYANKIFQFNLRTYTHLIKSSDWRAELQKHPEWKEKTAGDMEASEDQEARSFYRAFDKWARRESGGDRKMKRELTRQFFGYKFIDRSALQTIDDWEVEFQKHPEWQGKSPSQMNRDKASGASAFLASFRKWVKHTAPNAEARLSLTLKLFPDMKVIRRTAKKEGPKIDITAARKELRNLMEVQDE